MIRLDDLRTGRTLGFPDVTTVIEARSAAEVAPALQAVQDAADAGRWAAGYVAYEAASAFDPALLTRPPVPGLPLVWFGVADRPRPVPALEAAPYTTSDWTDGWTYAEYRDAVTAVRAAIAAGETYQCNLTTRLTSLFDGDPGGMYADVASAQRGAYNAYLDLGDHVVASASPELFFRLDGEHLLLRPMKGTAPRGATPAEDAALAEALRTSAKERAENVMIVDLLRNDAARIARTGTVDVPALCRLEHYPTVHQLTSDVTARLRSGVGLVDVFRALFPCGSVTGAPKASTMALIADLESGPRGVYCGAIGVVAPGRRAEFSVAIRTAVIDRRTGVATYGVGSGVTWPSVAADEYAELRAKAAVLSHHISRTTDGRHLV
ncbi:aminodeoxychorismate synthase component I [Cryptosporangium japonicum]|uniref:Chorismate-utilising enzyme C-terminal domain-containing protein n=1 Tax=Cryptosporangium japonicum TaxID=80872 RepID=A0ABN0UFQ4_9ACTN